jgi:predicted O-methyltransferase YrrM
MFSGFYDISARPMLKDGEGWQAPFADPTAPVNPFQGAWEFSQLLEIYRRLSPQRVLEIGSYRGGSLYQWLKHAPRGAKVITIDVPDSDAFKTLEEALQVSSQWPRWAPEGVEFHHLQCHSQDPSAKFRLLQFTDFLDFLFIDGNHSYPGVKMDFLTYGPLVRGGGVIVFHDILPNPRMPHLEVHRLWREIRQAGYATQELYVSPEQGAFGIGIVYVM